MLYFLVSTNRTSEKRARVRTVSAQSWGKFQEFDEIESQDILGNTHSGTELLEHDFDGKPELEIEESIESNYIPEIPSETKK